MSHRHHWLLAGGIGSGKSAVRGFLEDHGVHSIDADAVGHEVLADEALGPVAERWPEVVVDGKIDREALARIVFADPGELAALELITHPLIFGRIQARLNDDEGPAVVEVPVIRTVLDLPVMVVDAEDRTRLARSVARGMEPSDAERRMASQPSRAEWLATADLVIPNHGSLEDLEETVERLMPYLLPKE